MKTDFLKKGLGLVMVSVFVLSRLWPEQAKPSRRIGK